MNIRRAILSSIWILLPLLLAGCLFLSPDEESTSSSLSLDIRVPVSGELAKAPCPTAGQLLLEADTDLEAWATVFLTEERSAWNPQPAVDILVRTPLHVHPLEDGNRRLSGELDFDRGPAGPMIVLRVELFYKGSTVREIDGLYGGSLVLDSGLSASVDLMEIEPQVAENAHIAHFIVSAGGMTSPRETFPLFYDPLSNEMTASYQVGGVEWIEGEPPKIVDIQMTGGFEPSLIYSTSVPLADLIPGGKDQSVVVELMPVEPLQLHQVLIGNIRASFVDGTPPTEGGKLILLRDGQPCE